VENKEGKAGESVIVEDTEGAFQMNWKAERYRAFSRGAWAKALRSAGVGHVWERRRVMWV
jgi:hypothetical protein